MGKTAKLQALPGAACKQLINKWSWAANKLRGKGQQGSPPKQSLEISPQAIDTCSQGQEAKANQTCESVQNFSQTRVAEPGATPSRAQKSSHDAHSYGIGMSLTPASDVPETLKAAVLEHRRTVVKEDEIDTKLDQLNRDLSALRRHLCQLEYEIAELEHTGSEQAQSKLPSMRQQAKDMRAQRADVEEAQSQVHGDIDDFYQSQRTQQHQFFAALDDLLVGAAILDPRPTEAEQLQPSEQEVGSGAIEVLEEQGIHPSHSLSFGVEELATSPTRSVQRRPGFEDLQVQANAVGDAGSAVETSSADMKFDLLHRIHNRRLALRSAEDDFEERCERFEQEADDRVQKLEQGEEVEPIYDFDMRQLQETQELTRAIIEAEAALEAAKAAACAAGVQPGGSDAESGFVDDVEDGYRVSSEDDMIKSVRLLGKTEAWLDGLPEIGLATPCPRRADEPFEDAAGRGDFVDVCDWDAKSVEICDSWSICADGPQRKRIDKWRDVCGLS